MKYPSCIPCGRPKENAPPSEGRSRAVPPCFTWKTMPLGKKLPAPVTGRPGGRYCRSRPRLRSHGSRAALPPAHTLPGSLRGLASALLFPSSPLRPIIPGKRRVCQRGRGKECVVPGSGGARGRGRTGNTSLPSVWLPPAPVKPFRPPARRVFQWRRWPARTRGAFFPVRIPYRRAWQCRR